MQTILSIQGTSKIYKSGVQALHPVTLDIHKGEIFALLGPNGAGKTTLISIICGIVTPTSGTIIANGFDIAKDWRGARTTIGLVPQELHTDAFESVWTSVCFSRGLFGLPPRPEYIEKILRDLSLWDKKDAKINTLSGGMKRRVMIAKALSHEPRILFLDEPTAGVDVELRRDMWTMVRGLKEAGVTIILTTHYIEEAEDMADRVGVIAKGQLILVERKDALMAKLGKRRLTIALFEPMRALPEALSDFDLALEDEGNTLALTFDAHSQTTGIAGLIRRLNEAGIEFRDLKTEESSLEEIFVNLVADAT